MHDMQKLTKRFVPTIVEAPVDRSVSRKDVRASLWWVYEHMAGAMPRIEDAPNPGAWAHLKMLRDDEKARKAFYQIVFPKMMPAAKAVGEERKRGMESAGVRELLGRVRGRSGRPG